MTRDKLIKFLTENYEPDTELVWQSMEYKDFDYLDKATPELWSKFVEAQSIHLANDYSQNAADSFYDFIEKGDN
jgi:hypothetical protein